LLEREREGAQGVWYERLEAGLAGDAEALGVTRCLREGTRSRAAIAARLGMSVAGVTNARKRVARKVLEMKTEIEGEKR
jgi:hypothetical protein